MEEEIREMAGVKASAVKGTEKNCWIEVYELDARIGLRAVGDDFAYLTIAQARRLATQLEKIASRVDLQTK